MIILKKFVVNLPRSLNVFILCLLLVQPLTGAPISLYASSTTWHVYEDQSIQEAINNATAGDTIIIHNGTYRESIIVNKQLTIHGVDKSNTIIDGMGAADILYIYVQGVSLFNLTLLNASYGVHLYRADGAVLYDLDIYNCSSDGIYSDQSDFVSIENCTLKQAYRGINFWASFGVFIYGCNISESSYGFYFTNVNQAQIIGCRAYNLSYNGVILFSSYDVYIEGFEAYNCYNGIELVSSHQNSIFNSYLHKNLWDGVHLGDSNHNTIGGVNSTENGDSGFDLNDSDFNKIIESNSYNNRDQGLDARASDSLVVEGGHFYHNDKNGIDLDSCDITSIKGVHSHSNTYKGITASDSHQLTIFNCVLYNDTYGFTVYNCMKTYIRNTDSYNNTWDGAYLSESTGAIVNSNFMENGAEGLDFYKSMFNVFYSGMWDNDGNGLTSYVYNITAVHNWWGNETGPYHSLYNPDGTGSQISYNVIFEPWLIEPTSIGLLISDLRYQLRQLDWMVVYPDQVTPKPLGCGAAMTSDWLASAFVTTKLADITEGLDTNSSFVNQTTGETEAEPGTGILTFGGPFVNPIVKRAENDTTPEADRAPVNFHSAGDTFYFQYRNGTNIPGGSLPLSVINHNEDLFVIERYTDVEERLVTICYGFGWPGTYAAGKFFDREVFPNLEEFTAGWIIVHWEDTNGDGFVNNPGEGDTYTLIATGN